MSKLCNYAPDGDAFRCQLCGDKTDNKDLKRVCPVLRNPPAPASNKWSYGITTVPERARSGLLARTIESLAAAGFDRPRIFVDGLAATPSPCTIHEPPISAFGNWLLAAWELYLRNPLARYYAIFQDDCLASTGLRSYLERCSYPDRGYWNLYTDARNQRRLNGQVGWRLANQRGFGAVGLVFDNATLRTLLRSQHMVDRPQNRVRGKRNIDGAVVTALRKAGWREYVHVPSLLQHTGDHSTLGHPRNRRAPSYTGRTPDRARVGLVGYNCYSGLGVMNRQIAAHADPWSWLVKPHAKHETLPPLHAGIETITCRSGGAVEAFVKSVDVVLFAETPYYPDLVRLARKHRRRIVCVPMLERLPGSGWTKHVDVFLCPTAHCYEVLKAEGLPCELFAWPTDVAGFSFRQRDRARRFLYLHGRGGANGRKGGDVIRQALAMWPEMPLVVRSQAKERWPDGVEVLPAAPTNATLYDVGDVLIVPHRADGLCLQPMEAAAAGMPAIVPEGRPWEHLPRLTSFVSPVVRRFGRSDWHEPDAANLVAICREMVGADIAADSRMVRQRAEANAWGSRAAAFNVATSRTRLTRFSADCLPS